MTDDNLTIGELGAYTNNSMNREGIKKLVDKVNNGGSSGDAYTKAETDALLDEKQDVLTAGDNIAISEENVISATDTKYTAGTNVEISEQNVISATDTKYTAGTGIAISEQNVISATGDGDWTLRTPNNDWSDIFNVDTNNSISAKKDLLIQVPTKSNCYWFIPKNVNLGITISLLDDIIEVDATDSSALKMGHNIEISYNNISSGTQIPVRYSLVKFTISNDAITMNITKPNQNYMKSNFTIYTKD